MEAYKLRMDWLEVVIEDPGKELHSLKKRVIIVEKASGRSEGSLTIKADIDYLKKEVASLQFIDLSTFWNGLEDPS